MLVKLTSPISFYFFNIPMRTFKITYVVHITFLWNGTGVDSSSEKFSIIYLSWI